MSDPALKPLPAHGGNRVWGFIRCLLTPRACSRVKKLLYQFVEGELDPVTHQQLQSHLADCPLCLDFVESYRRTIALCRCHGLRARPLPPALRDKLSDFIAQHPELK